MKNTRRNLFLSGIINEHQEMSFVMDLPKEIQILNDAFKQSGHKLYIVGGAVRDVLLGKTPKDYDVTTVAKPEEVVNILNNYEIYNFPKGEAFGVVSAVINGEEFEIATFRSEKYDGSGRRPAEVEYSTIEQDSERRDLTINALYYDMEDKKIVDFHNGIEDIKNRRIRTVKEPEDRFYEDRLRVMRAIRLKHVIGGGLDEKTKKAILKYNEMPGVSNERIRDEFYSGLKKSKDSKLFLKDLYDFGIMKRMFPKLSLNINFLDSKNPILVVSFILKNNTSDLIISVLTEMKYNNEEKKAVKFLIDFLNLFSEFSKINYYLIDINNFSKLLSLKDSVKNIITKEGFLKWAKINNLNENIANKFYDFKELKIKDLPEVEDKIISGEIPAQSRELGLEIKNANFKRFINLI
jgi:tRNA nucleotidyltransferase/poly(A) polymerase